MPTYEYSCSSCENKWEESHKISERKTPESLPCPKCGAKTVTQGIFTAPPFGDPVRLGLIKPNSGFKEVIAKVKERSPGSVL